MLDKVNPNTLKAAKSVLSEGKFKYNPDDDFRKVNGKYYQIKQFYTDKDANAYMEKNPKWGVIDTDKRKGIVYVAHKDDKGVSQKNLPTSESVELEEQTDLEAKAHDVCVEAFGKPAIVDVGSNSIYIDVLLKLKNFNSLSKSQMKILLTHKQLVHFQVRGKAGTDWNAAVRFLAK